MDIKSILPVVTRSFLPAGCRKVANCR